MEPDRRQFEDGLRSRLAEIYQANPWLVAVDIDQSALRLARRLQTLTATSVLVVGARHGVGPTDPLLPVHSMGLPSTGDGVRDMHSAAEAFQEPPPKIIEIVDRWDPDRKARAIGAITAVAGSLVGRETFGARPQAWADLEDKLAIEAVWDEAGIEVAPTIQVEVDDPDALLAAHRELGSEQGTVWAGDNRSGWHGGGRGTFWVPDEGAAATMGSRLDSYDLVRVMPFVEGIPCSMHGMVVPDGRGDGAVAVFRPTEMMILRSRAETRLVYGRSSTFWDPADADRATMRDVGRRIGEVLWRRVGYRGAFTVDGILGAGGFVPTEVNTRYGAALGFEMETMAGPPLDLFFIHLAVVEGLLDGLDPDALQRWVTANLDRHRRAAAFVDIDASPGSERTMVIHRSPTPGGPLTVTEHEPAPAGAAVDVEPDRVAQDRVAQVRWGTARGGGMLMIDLGPSIPKGPSTAPLLVEIIDAVDRHWGLGIPPLAAARPVR